MFVFIFTLQSILTYSPLCHELLNCPNVTLGCQLSAKISYNTLNKVRSKTEQSRNYPDTLASKHFSL
jgi:hypothetical protein